ncbi:methylated-DNA-protein-cysteine S-methyltransferase related protein [Xanthomonas translucens pv. graminis ART-Xtg29]|nr:methylated-DNA-protein-cysteine S-methyltransferase related protein [Xanthomonas translucens pv. graminis ART-Xtg29]
MSGRRAAADAAASALAHARILATIRAIPSGQVRGYGEVAMLAGLPGRARLVARVLGGNTDTTLPWHRVLRSDGRIAFAEGSRGFREQCQRLGGEGVAVQGGRVKRDPTGARSGRGVMGAAIASGYDGRQLPRTRPCSPDFRL